MSNARRMDAAVASSRNTVRQTDRSKNALSNDDMGGDKPSSAQSRRSRQGSARQGITSNPTSQQVSKDETAGQYIDVYDPRPPESHSLVQAQAIIDKLLATADNEITWLELKKHKVPFVTSNMRLLVKRVSELHFMKADPRRMEQNDSHNEQEPMAARADIDAPYMIKTKYKPPPVPLINFGSGAIDKLKRKISPAMRGMIGGRSGASGRKSMTKQRSSVTSISVQKSFSQTQGPGTLLIPGVNVGTAEKEKDPDATSEGPSPRSQVSFSRASMVSAGPISPAVSKKSRTSKLDGTKIDLKKKKSSDSKSFKGARRSIDETSKVQDDEYFKAVPLNLAKKTEELLPAEQEKQLARARKVIAQRDEQIKRRLQVRGQMKQFISNMMREKGDGSEHDSLASVIKAPEFDDGASDLPPAEAEKRNQEIFKNLTFDDEGNPIQMHKLDPEKLVAQTTMPRYKIQRKRRDTDEEQELAAIKALKNAKAMRKRVALSQTDKRGSNPVSRNGNISKTSDAAQMPAMSPKDAKLHSLLERLHHKSALQALLFTDDKHHARRYENSVKSDINTELNMTRGVDLKTEVGTTLKSGGKYNLHPGSLKYATQVQSTPNMRLNGLSGFGPRSQSISDNAMMQNLAEAMRRKISSKMSTNSNLGFNSFMSKQFSVGNLWGKKTQPKKPSVDKIVCEIDNQHEEICGMLNLDFYSPELQPQKSPPKSPTGKISSQNMLQQSQQQSILDQSKALGDIRVGDFDITGNEQSIMKGLNSIFSQSPISGNVQPESQVRSAIFLQRRMTSQSKKSRPPLPVQSYEYLPMPGTSQGNRKTDFNRRSLLNPNNDRDVRLSHEFSSMRGAVQSPQIALPERAKRRDLGLSSTQSSTQLASSYQTRNFRHRKLNSHDQFACSGAFNSTAASKLSKINV